MKMSGNLGRLLAVLLLAVSAAACASSNGAGEYSDPFEPFNRKVHGFNTGLDEAVIVPVSKGYRAITPNPVEAGVSNFFDNLSYPLTATNQLLQGKPGKGIEAVLRFGINTTIGIAGIFDVATPLGLEHQKEDFGQTFAKWGFASGPYIVVPLRGGMTLRDAAGGVAGIPLNPVYYVEDADTATGLRVLSVVDRSASLLDERRLVARDSYLFQRDAYIQRRQYQIRDGAVVEDDPFLDE